MAVASEGPAERDSWVRSESNSKLKLAELTAMRIERLIADEGWPEGRLLGTEPELQVTYGVSRAVLREAIRLLEHHGVASMRRGGSGGLIVTRPSPTAAVRPSELYLEWAGVSARQLLEARAPLELAAIRSAAENLTEEDVLRLRACVDTEERSMLDAPGNANVVEFDESVHDLHIVLADISGNAALRLFIEILTKLSHESSGPGEFFVPGGHARRPKEVVQELHHTHKMIAEAVIAGDAALASRRMMKHLDAMAQWISRGRG